MFRKYPHDIGMQSIDTAERSLENDLIHGKIISGSSAIACTANVGASSAITFSMPFSPSSIPDIMVCITSLGALPSVIKYLVAASASATGFTIQILTDTTQSITVTWYAKGITN